MTLGVLPPEEPQARPNTLVDEVFEAYKARREGRDSAVDAARRASVPLGAPPRPQAGAASAPSPAPAAPIPPTEPVAPEGAPMPDRMPSPTRQEAFPGANEYEDKVRSGLGENAAAMAPPAPRTDPWYRRVGVETLKENFRRARDSYKRNLELAGAATRGALAAGKETLDTLASSSATTLGHLQTGLQAIGGAYRDDAGPLGFINRPIGAAADVLAQLAGELPMTEPTPVEGAAHRAGNLFTDVALGAVENIPQLLLMAANPSSAMAQVFVQTAGASYDNAKARGADEETAQANAVVNAAVQTALEYINRIPGVEKKAEKTIVKATARAGARLLKQAGLEGLEEVSQSIAQAIIDARTLPEYEHLTLEGLTKDFLVGGLIGFILQGPQHAAESEIHKELQELQRGAARWAEAEAEAERLGIPESAPKDAAEATEGDLTSTQEAGSIDSPADTVPPTPPSEVGAGKAPASPFAESADSASALSPPSDLPSPRPGEESRSPAAMQAEEEFQGDSRFQQTRSGMQQAQEEIASLPEPIRRQFLANPEVNEHREAILRAETAEDVENASLWFLHNFDRLVTAAEARANEVAKIESSGQIPTLNGPAAPTKAAEPTTPPPAESETPESTKPKREPLMKGRVDLRMESTAHDPETGGSVSLVTERRVRRITDADLAKMDEHSLARDASWLVEEREIRGGEAGEWTVFGWAKTKRGAYDDIAGKSERHDAVTFLSEDLKAADARSEAAQKAAQEAKEKKEREEREKSEEEQKRRAEEKAAWRKRKLALRKEEERRASIKRASEAKTQEMYDAAQAQVGKMSKNAREQFARDPRAQELLKAVREAETDEARTEAQKAYLYEHPELFKKAREALRKGSGTLIEPTKAPAAPKPAETTEASSEAESHLADEPGKVIDPETGEAVPGGVVYTTGDKTYAFKWRVVDARTPVKSHTTDFLENPEFVERAGKQPRERDRAGMMQQVLNIAARLVGARVGESVQAQDGAPIIYSDMVVEGGNGRALALELMYKNHPEVAARYREWLAQKAKELGLREDPSQFDQPALVRERLGPPEARDAFVTEANAPTVARYGAAEQARLDSDKLTPDILSLFVPNDTGDIDTVANRDFVRAFAAQVVGDADVNTFFDERGGLSQEGRGRIRNALLAAAYGDMDTVARVAESLSSEMGAVGQTLVSLAPVVARFKAAIARGERFGSLDIAKDIAAAALQIDSLRREGKSVAEWLKNQTLFELESTEGEKFTPEARFILEKLEEVKRSRGEQVDFLNRYFRLADDPSNDPRQEGLFGAPEAPNKLDLLKKAWETRHHTETLDFGGPEGETRGVPETTKRTSDFGPPPAQETTPEVLAGVDLDAGPHPAGKKAEPLGTMQVLKRLVGIWGIHIRRQFAGRAERRSAQYKARHRVIELRSLGRIGEAAHELGHHVYREAWTQIAKVPDAIRDALVKKGRELYANDPDFDELSDGFLAEEGFAEVVYHALVKRDPAHFSPTLHSWLLGELLPQLPEISRKFAETRTVFDALRNKSALELVLGALDVHGHISKEGRTVWSYLQRWARAHNKHWWDKFEAVRHFEQEIIKEIEKRGLRVPKGVLLPQNRASIILDAHYDAEGSEAMDRLNTTLRPHMEGLTRPELDRAFAFAYAQAFLEMTDPNRVNSEGEPMPPLPIPVPREVAQRVFDELDTPQNRRFADAIQEYANGLVDFVVENRLMTPEVGEAIKKSHAHYVPMMRVLDPSFHAYRSHHGIGMADQPTLMHRRRGSELPIQDPMLQLGDMGRRFIRQALMARAASALAELSEAAGDILGHTVFEEIKLPAEVRTLAVEQIERQLLDLPLGIDPDVLREHRDEILHYWVASNQPRLKTGEAVLALVVNGKLRHYVVHDAELAEAMTALGSNPRGMLWAYATSVLGPFKKTITALATGLNAGFSLITNPIRDVWFGSVRTQYKHGAELAAHSAKWWAKQLQGRTRLLQNDPVYQAWSSMGGPMSTILSEIYENFGRELYIELGMKPENWRDWWMRVAQAKEIYKQYIGLTESATRLAEFEGVYKRALKEGMSEADARLKAAYHAAEITLNFRAGGTWSRELNKIVPFFNASMLGMRSTFRALTGKDGVKAHKALIRGLAGLTLPALALWWKNKDEEWYRELAPYERAMYVVDKIGGSVIRLPLPHEFGLIFATLPVALLDSAYRKTKGKGFDWANFGSVIGSGIEAVTPDFVPPLAQLAVDLSRNKDSRGGYPIVPSRYRDLRPPEQYSETTPILWKEIAHAIDVGTRGFVKLSPFQIQYAAENLTGGFSKNIAGFGKEREAADYPVVGRLFSRQMRVGSSAHRLKALDAELSAYVKSINALVERGRIAEAERLERLYADDIGLDRRYRPGDSRRHPKYERISKAAGEIRQLAKQKIRDREYYERSNRIAARALDLKQPPPQGR